MVALPWCLRVIAIHRLKLLANIYTGNIDSNVIPQLELEKNKDGTLLIPFSSVIAVGDFVVVAEEDIV